MSVKELEAKTKEFNENDMRKLIKDLMGRPPEEIDNREIAMSKPHENIKRSVRIAIAKWLQKEFEENEELDDLHFKAAIAAGFIGEEPVP